MIFEIENMDANIDEVELTNAGKSMIVKKEDVEDMEFVTLTLHGKRSDLHEIMFFFISMFAKLQELTINGKWTVSLPTLPRCISKLTLVNVKLAIVSELQPVINTIRLEDVRLVEPQARHLFEKGNGKPKGVTKVDLCGVKYDLPRQVIEYAINCASIVNINSVRKVVIEGGGLNQKCMYLHVNSPIGLQMIGEFPSVHQLTLEHTPLFVDEQAKLRKVYVTFPNASMTTPKEYEDKPHLRPRRLFIQDLPAAEQGIIDQLQAIGVNVMSL
jgi:hypothetical protein